MEEKDWVPCPAAAATNYRKRFCSPQVIKTSTQVENSQLQLGQNSRAYELIKREGESDSTSARTRMRFPKPTGVCDIHRGMCRRQQNKYPTLSKVAKDVLAVLVSTIASEASFSTGCRVINPQRSSLSPKMVEALICGQNWLRSSPNKIDIRQTIADLHKYEELAQELGGLEFREA